LAGYQRSIGSSRLAAHIKDLYQALILKKTKKLSTQLDGKQTKAETMAHSTHSYYVVECILKQKMTHPVAMQCICMFVATDS
jgi:hypothetical protein